MGKIKSKVGQFMARLSETNDDTNNERVKAIYDTAEVTHKRTIENTEMKIRNLKIKRDALLDFKSNGNVKSYEDFGAVNFVKQDTDLSFEIDTEERVLKILKERYSELFN